MDLDMDISHLLSFRHFINEAISILSRHHDCRYQQWFA